MHITKTRKGTNHVHRKAMDEKQEMFEMLLKNHQ